MLRTNSKKVIEKVRSYIINGVEHEYFGLEADSDFNTACKLILTACENEKRFITFKGAFTMVYYRFKKSLTRNGARFAA